MYRTRSLCKSASVGFRLPTAMSSTTPRSDSSRHSGICCHWTRSKQQWSHEATMLSDAQKFIPFTTKGRTSRAGPRGCDPIVAQQLAQHRSPGTTRNCARPLLLMRGARRSATTRMQPRLGGDAQSHPRFARRRPAGVACMQHEKKRGKTRAAVHGAPAEGDESQGSLCEDKVCLQLDPATARRERRERGGGRESGAARRGLQEHQYASREGQEQKASRHDT